MRLKALFIVLAVILPLVAMAQEHSSSSQQNTVTVGADGQFEAEPDTAQFEFDISSQQQTAKDAYQHVAQDTEQVRGVLRTNGIDLKAAEFGYFSLQPMYDNRDPKHKLVGYRVSARVSLKLKDFSKIAPIMQQMAESGITENQSLNYILQDVQSAKDSAVRDAYQNARRSAEVIAHASGRALGELSYASANVNENAPVLPYARAAGAMKESFYAPAEQFTPQEVRVTAHVNAVFMLR